jgi:hypothetical protein
VKTVLGAISVNDIFSLEEKAVPATSLGDSKPKSDTKKAEKKKTTHVIEILQGGEIKKVEF